MPWEKSVIYAIARTLDYRPLLYTSPATAAEELFMQSLPWKHIIHTPTKRGEDGAESVIWSIPGNGNLNISKLSAGLPSNCIRLFSATAEITFRLQPFTFQSHWSSKLACHCHRQGQAYLSHPALYCVAASIFSSSTWNLLSTFLSPVLFSRCSTQSPVSTTRVNGPSWRPELTGRQLGPSS